MTPTSLTHRASVRAAALLATVALLAVSLAAPAAASSEAVAARGAERVAILKAFARNDGNTHAVTGVFTSRSVRGLAVACERTAERGYDAYVFARHGSGWRYATSGAPGRAGNAADRRLEHACP